MDAPPRILVAGRDPDVRGSIAGAFGGGAITEVVEETGVLRTMYAARPDLVLLDPPTERRALLSLIRRIRELSDVPLIVLGADTGDDTQVRALCAGADGYITKPFSSAELQARAEALLRRAHKSTRPAREEEPYTDALIRLDPVQVRVHAAGKPVELTAQEFRLLAAFVRNPNRVLSAEELLSLAWRDGSSRPNRVKLYVRYLRRKFRERGIELPIVTMRGFGYRYAPSPASPATGEALAGLESQLASLDAITGPHGQPFFASPAARSELARDLARPGATT